MLSWSGGKDCTMALARLRGDPSVRVAGLLTTVTDAYDRVSMHGTRRTLLRRQAALLGLPVREVVLPADASNEAYEEAMGRAVGELADEGVGTFAFGDIHLADVRAYREEQLARAGAEAVFPLWGEETSALAEGFVSDGHRAVVVCVDTELLDGSFCGRDYDGEFLRDLPEGVDPCGEEGAFHTFVHDGPHLSEPIGIERGEQVLRDGRVRYQDLRPTQGERAPGPAA